LRFEVTDPKIKDRREFLAQVVTAAAVVVASTGCAVPLAAAGSGATSQSSPFDDGWTRRVSTAKYRAVFDSPDINEGLALLHATFYRQGYQEQFGLGPSDVIPVVVFRHVGTVMALNDALWEKYALGERSKLIDPATGKDAVRNPFIRVGKDEKNSVVPADASIEALAANGVVMLVCNKATMRLAGQVAAKFGKPVEEVRAEFKAAVVPGVLLQPSGVYAVLRAQDVGCGFLKST
jgi:intracellular sulfur oxidation DsrE/DsrF family protein